MSMKILLAVGLATAAGGAVYATTSDTEPTAPAPSEQAAVASPPSADQAEPAPAPTVVAQAKPQSSRELWQARRARIQAARAKAASEAAATKAQANTNTWHTAQGDELELDEHEGHVMCPIGSPCFDSLNQELAKMIQGCSDFFVHDAPAVTLTATVIGAPGEGTIIDSVDLEGEGDEASADLVECLTESVYTLELEPTDEELEREITLSMGGPMDGMEIDDETRAAIEQALASHGIPEGIEGIEGAHTIFVGVDHEED